jgi:PAS domain-containing protein
MPPGLASAFARLKQALPVPPEPRDGQEPWVARSLQVLTLAMTVGLVLVILENWLAGRFESLLTAWPLVAELAVVQVVAVMNHRGFPTAGARILAASVPLLAMLLMLTGLGFRDPAGLALPASLLLCGLMLDRRSLAALTVLTIACAAVVLGAEARRLVGFPGEPYPSVFDLTDVLIILVATAVGVDSVAQHLREALRRARRNEAARRASEERYRALVDLAADAILVGRKVEGLSEANRRADDGQEVGSVADRRLPEHARHARGPLPGRTADGPRAGVSALTACLDGRAQCHVS